MLPLHPAHQTPRYFQAHLEFPLHQADRLDLFVPAVQSNRTDLAVLRFLEVLQLPGVLVLLEVLVVLDPLLLRFPLYHQLSQSVLQRLNFQATRLDQSDLLLPGIQYFPQFLVGQLVP